MELPYTGRAIFDDNFGNITITIPTKKNWFIIAFFCVWISMWFFGETSVSGGIFSANPGGVDAFEIVWLCGWTIGGLFAIRTIIWNLFGKEIITIGQGALNIDKKGAIFYKAKSYDLREVKNFRAEEESYGYNRFGGRSDNSLFNLDKKGTIRFDYGMKTIKFGDGLDEAEANYLLQKLRDKKLIN